MSIIDPSDFDEIKVRIKEDSDVTIIVNRLMALKI